MSTKYVDVKITVWERHHFSDDADMSKVVEVIKETLDISEIFGDELGFLETETLYETAEEMEVTENGGCSTIEVYDINKIPIYMNGIEWES